MPNKKIKARQNGKEKGKRKEIEKQLVQTIKATQNGKGKGKHKEVVQPV